MAFRAEVHHAVQAQIDLYGRFFLGVADKRNDFLCIHIVRSFLGVEWSQF